MLLMVEKGITAGIVCAIRQYAKPNNSHINESSYLKYWDGNNLYGWAMSQKLPVINFESIEDTSQIEDFIKNCSEESDEGYFFEVDVQYPEKLHEFHNDLPVLSERINLEKVKKLVSNLHYKTECFIYIRNLKQC